MKPAHVSTLVIVGGVALGALLLASCLGRSLPIPPPGVTTDDETVCPASQCPMGGVIVSLTGTATPGATVIIIDTNPADHLPGGGQLSTTAVASSLGAWAVLLGPTQPDPPTNAVLAPQHGDTLNVFQITTGPEGGASNSTYEQIP